MSTVLTMSGYSRMTPDHRKQFDAWLLSEALHNYVYECSFGEGTIDVKCYAKDELGHPYLIAKGQPATEEHTFHLRTPPPSFVFGYCA